MKKAPQPQEMYKIKCISLSLSLFTPPISPSPSNNLSSWAHTHVTQGDKKGPLYFQNPNLYFLACKIFLELILIRDLQPINRSLSFLVIHPIPYIASQHSRHAERVRCRHYSVSFTHWCTIVIMLHIASERAWENHISFPLLYMPLYHQYTLQIVYRILKIY